MWEATGGGVHSTEGRCDDPVSDRDEPSGRPSGPLNRTSPKGTPDDALDTAVRALYHAHGAALLSYLMRLTKGDRDRAEDLLQETLLRAWKHPEARDADGAWSPQWLFTVARRIAIDHIRATVARPTEIGDERLDERAADRPSAWISSPTEWRFARP